MKINRRTLAIIVVLVVLAVAGFILRLFIVPSALIVIGVKPVSPILPYDKLVITLSGDPSAGKCRVVSDVFNSTQYSVSMDSRSITIDPIINWPFGTPIGFNLTCTNIKQTLSFQVVNQSSITPDQQFQIEAHGAKQIGQGRANYLSSHPYISSFPIARTKYFMMYVETGNYIYVVSNDDSVFTPGARAQIEAIERPELNKLGVPATVPLIFQGDALPTPPPQSP